MRRELAFGTVAPLTELPAAEVDCVPGAGQRAFARQMLRSTVYPPLSCPGRSRCETR